MSAVKAMTQKEQRFLKVGELGIYTRESGWALTQNLG